MGVLDKITKAFRAKRDIPVLVVGLDNAGKSALINSLRAPEERKPLAEVEPTVGMVEESVSCKNVSVTFFDMSGQGRYRSMW